MGVPQQCPRVSTTTSGSNPDKRLCAPSVHVDKFNCGSSRSHLHLAVHFHHMWPLETKKNRVQGYDVYKLCVGGRRVREIET